VGGGPGGTREQKNCREAVRSWAESTFTKQKLVRQPRLLKASNIREGGPRAGDSRSRSSRSFLEDSPDSCSKEKWEKLREPREWAIHHRVQILLAELTLRLTMASFSSNPKVYSCCQKEAKCLNALNGFGSSRFVSCLLAQLLFWRRVMRRVRNWKDQPARDAGPFA